MGLNVFVVGLDEVNGELLHQIENVDQYSFHEVLSLERVQGAERYPIDRWLDHARDRIRETPGSADGIIGFWDFPISLMVPILIDEFDTTGPQLRSVVNCEHKYWSRLSQHEVVPEAVPQFRAVNPADEASVADIDLSYPFWIKPVKAFASQLGFKISSDADLADAIRQLRQGISRFGKPFNHFLSRIALPANVEGIDGSWCVAEELLTGSQHTVAGYAVDGDVHVYGMIDSINYPNSTSFFRYRYPSQLPQSVQQRAASMTRRIMSHIGFTNWPFNIEVFYDSETDRLRLLELNTRISQSHSDLFRKVDGVSNHQVLVQIATGQSPTPPSRCGDCGVASKFHARAFRDGVVTRTPTEEEIRHLQREIPGAIVRVHVNEGDRLSELEDQEPYSYRLAVAYLGGDTDEQLLEQWERCEQLLRFEIDEAQTTS